MCEYQEINKEDLFYDPVHLNGHKIIFADWTASSVPCKFVDKHTNKIMPYYSNTHSNAYCGTLMKNLVAKTKNLIRKKYNLTDEYKIIFTGSGATGAINHMIHCMNLLVSKTKINIFLSMFEHHSNYLPWIGLVSKSKEIGNNNINIILATGLSFSVPEGAKIPPSLRNIYRNLIKFGHINEAGNGNLESWSKQGCLLLNTSLTVTKGKPNCHKKIWKTFTDNLIKYISDNTENVMFVLWGNESLSKQNLIDNTKHNFTISSHPSGLSYDKKMGIYNAFIDTDHFGMVNTYLKSINKKQIKW